MNTPLPQFAMDFYRHYKCFLGSLQSVLLLIIRLTWGFMFIQTGWGKWHDIPKVVGFFTDLGIPFPTLNAYVVATTELVGGTFFLLGLLSRFATIPLIIAMVVAYITSEKEALLALTMGDPDPFFSAAPFLFLFVSLIVLIFGPGKISLDHLLAKLFASEKTPDTTSRVMPCDASGNYFGIKSPLITLTPEHRNRPAAPETQNPKQKETK